MKCLSKLRRGRFASMSFLLLSGNHTGRSNRLDAENQNRHSDSWRAEEHVVLAEQRMYALIARENELLGSGGGPGARKAILANGGGNRLFLLDLNQRDFFAAGNLSDGVLQSSVYQLPAKLYPHTLKQAATKRQYPFSMLLLVISRHPRNIRCARTFPCSASATEMLLTSSVRPIA